jgi:hypothetical protein
MSPAIDWVSCVSSLVINAGQLGGLQKGSHTGWLILANLISDDPAPGLRRPNAGLKIEE